MSRATISTGDITFTSQSSSSSSSVAQQCKLLILGDFSGRASLGKFEPDDLAKRRIYKVDKDNFDDVFTELAPTFKLPFQEKAIRFNELEDMEPDYLIEKLSIFAELRALGKQLQKPETAQKALARLGIDQQGTSDAEPDAVEDTEMSVSLASLFEQAEANQTSDINSYIKEIVGPYLQSDPTGSQSQLESYINSATQNLLREVMHSSGFQNLEASWRSLKLLLKRLEKDQRFAIFILDVSWQELQAEAKKGDSVLEQRFVDYMTTAGDRPFDLMLVDFTLQQQLEDLKVLTRLSAIAKTNNATLLMNIDETFAGCNDIRVQDTKEWNAVIDLDCGELFRQFRTSPAAQHCVLTAPGFLLRMPYGKNSKQIEKFNFEELAPPHHWDYYLWGKACWLMTLMLLQSFERFKWQFEPGKINCVDKLPLHVYRHDTEATVTPCAQVLTTDSMVKVFEDHGICLLRSIHQKDAVLVSQFISASSEDGLKGPWSRH